MRGSSSRARRGRDAPAADVIARARRVGLVLLDVDGVLAADRLLVDARGRTLRAFSGRDLAAVTWLMRAGIRVALLTERRATVAQLGRTLAVHAVVERVTTGVASARRLCRRWRLTPSELAFVGDDVLDQPLFAFAGLAITVADGAPGVRRHAHFATRAPGGAGAVREIAELLLRAQGKWASVLGESMR